MANPTKVGLDLDYNPALVKVDTTGVTIPLDANKEYLLMHLGVDTQSSPAASTATIYYGYGIAGTAVDNTGVEGTNKFPLLSGQQTLIGPGVSSLGMRSSSGNVGVSFSVGPSDFGVH